MKTLLPPLSKYNSRMPTLEIYKFKYYEQNFHKNWQILIGIIKHKLNGIYTSQL